MYSSGSLSEKRAQRSRAVRPNIPETLHPTALSFYSAAVSKPSGSELLLLPRGRPPRTSHYPPSASTPKRAKQTLSPADEKRSDLTAKTKELSTPEILASRVRGFQMKPAFLPRPSPELPTPPDRTETRNPPKLQNQSPTRTQATSRRT